MTSSVTEHVDLVPASPADRGMRPVADVIARVRLIQEVMQTLMKDGVHFGTIPGTPKPTLYKPGAELILMTFRIAAAPSVIEDLSTEDVVRYRVTVRGSNQATSDVLGEMSGECSSDEEKYRWRKPVCDEEWQETAVDRRREKWAKGQGGKTYKQKQIRTWPADVANTVLKMAIKRALIAMTLVTTAASDIFAQDLEDLSQELREQLAGSDAEATASKPAVQPPQRKSEAKKSTETKAPEPAAEQSAEQATKPSVIAAVQQPDGKQFYVIKLKDDERFFTTFKNQVAEVADKVSGTETRVVLTFVEKVAGEKKYFNVTAVTLVGTPAAPSTPAADPSEPVITADDINFGQPGAQS